MVGDLVAAGDVLDKPRNHRLSDIHDVFHVGIGNVKLASGKLGVVGQVNALVTELPSNFVDTVHAADDEHLKVKFRSDSHEQIHLELVVVGNERLGRGTSSNHVHHWCLDLTTVGSVSSPSFLPRSEISITNTPP